MWHIEAIWTCKQLYTYWIRESQRVYITKVRPAACLPIPQIALHRHIFP